MPEPAYIIDETPSPAERGVPIRFLWRADAQARFTEVSPELAGAVGHEAAAIVGRTWEELCASLIDDPDGEIASRFAGRQTWSGQVVYWSSGSRQIAVDFAGQPIFNAERELVGFRGFGLVRAEAGSPAPRRAHEPPVLVAPPRVFIPEARGAGGGASWFSDMRQRLMSHLGVPKGSEPTKGPEQANVQEPVPSPAPVPAPEKPPREPRRSEAALSDAERNAFREIARALGRTDAAEGNAEQTPVPLEDRPEPAEADAEGLKTRLQDLEGQLEAARRELAAAQQRLATANAGKADVLARVAQETRASLDAIIAFSGGMLQERLGPLGSQSYKEYLTDIRASAIRVSELIEDLSELAKIEAGRVALSPGAVSLNELVESCVGEVQSRASRERVVIRTSLAPDLPPALLDQTALKQIAHNLIANAVSVTPAGGQVIVSTSVGEAGEVAFRLRDGGPAMSESQLAAALEPFGASGATSHAGFGLARAKAIVEANGGKLTVSAGAGAGTLIELTFRSAAQG